LQGHLTFLGGGERKEGGGEELLLELCRALAADTH